MYVENKKNINQNLIIMKIKFLKLTTLSALVLSLGLGISSCKKEDDPMDPTTPAAKSSTFNYEFNNGQVVSSAAYDGTHKDNLTAMIKVEEATDGKAKITVTLDNTINGEMYMIHSHDAADPTTTPNMTPYNETPNSDVFTKMVTGNGGSVSVSQTSTKTYTEITSSYDGFFVVHDPLQSISTTDISTYLFVGAFARTQTSSGLARGTFNYAFNTGQVAAAFAYSGTHANTLAGTIDIQELADGKSRVTVSLENTINSQTYMVHSHDKADPTTTPNMTPYNETPNSSVCTMMVSGNGGPAYNSQISTMTHSDLTTTYDGFFVVHDPLQAITTTDPTTYVLLGSFAR